MQKQLPDTPLEAAAAIADIRLEAAALQQLLASLSSEIFMQPHGEKWSIAQDVVHLELSVRPLKLVFGLPRLMLWWRFGKANRPSRTPSELYDRYQARLSEGVPIAAAAGFQPRVAADASPPQLIARFEEQHDLALRKAAAYPAAALDNYVVPHPLLGKITLRELLYFTAFHIRLHHDIIRLKAKID